MDKKWKTDRNYSKKLKVKAYRGFYAVNTSEIYLCSLYNDLCKVM